MRRVIILFVLPVIIICNGCSKNGDTIGGSGLVSAETSGRVMSLNFGEGDLVLKDDTLLIIDPSRLELALEVALAGLHVTEARLHTTTVQLEQAEKTEEYAKSEFDRITKLYESGTTTRKNYDRLEYEYNQAVITRKASQANIMSIEAELVKIKADIKTIERQLTDCYPHAPDKGTIIEKYVETGELLSPGKAIAKIARLDTVWVKIYLAAGEFAGVKIGDGATVDTESGDIEYAGQVIWTSDEAEFTPKNVQTEQSRADLVFAVKVRIPNVDGKLKIGMPVFVSLEEE